MKPLISPNYNFEVFCYHMTAKDPVDVIEESSAEAWRAKKLHQRTSRESKFRPGTKGQTYCEKLHFLTSTLVNGTIPQDAPPEFRKEIRPLILRILERWNIESLRQEFDDDTAVHTGVAQ